MQRLMPWRFTAVEKIQEKHMDGWEILGMIFAALIAATVVFEIALNAKDFARYLKIRSMSK